VIIYLLAFFQQGPTVSVPVLKDLSSLSIEQVAIVYDQCLARVVGKASRTDVPPESVFGIAKDACAPTRNMLVHRSPG
jgi:hypothetical protein